MGFVHLIIRECCVQHPRQWSNAVLCLDQWKTKINVFRFAYKRFDSAKKQRTQMIARALMEEEEPKVKNTLAKHLKNSIRSVCNCVLWQRNHFVIAKMLLISKRCWMLFELMIPFGMIIVYSTTINHIDIYHMKKELEFR